MMKPNMKTLIELLEQNTPSGREDATRKYLINKLYDIGFECRLDAYGNLYGVRGISDSYPLLNAHMDIVEDSFSYSRGTSRYKNRTESLKSDYFAPYEAYNSYNSYKWHMPETQIDMAYEEELALDTLIEGYVLSALDSIGDSIADLKDDAQFTEDEMGELVNTQAELQRIYNDLQVIMTASTRLAQLHTLSVELLDLILEFDYGLYEAYDMELEGILAEFRENEAVDAIYKVSYDIAKDEISGSGGRVLGGDDKCGIFIALTVLEQLRDMPAKVLFTVEEEIGCVGIDQFVKTNVDFFDNVGYNLTIDRRGGTDLLHKQCGKRSCSWEFAGKLAYHGVVAGVPVTLDNGSIADVITIRDYVPNSVNMSAGYYDAHSDGEYVIWGEVLDIITWVRNILSDKSLLTLKPFREFSKEIIIPKKRKGGKKNGK